jgi:GT2 family glycosyltransferase
VDSAAIAACAIVVTLPFADVTTARSLSRAALTGFPLVAVPYADADGAAVRAACEPLRIPVIEAPPGAAFGAAANAGAAATRGTALAFIDGAEALSNGWQRSLLAALAAAGGGVAGPHVVSKDGEECGSVLTAAPLSQRGFDFARYGNVPRRIAVDCVPRDCLITSRAAFDELSGFATAFGSELEAVDYCLRIAESGRSVLFEPAASFARHAPPPPADPAGARAFALCWRERAEPHENFWPELTSALVRRTFHNVGILVEHVPIPAYTVLVHGATAPPEAFAQRLSGGRLRPASVVWAVPGDVPPGAQACDDAVAAARALTELRGPDCVAFLRGDTQLGADWLNELVNAIERAPDTVAATVTGATGRPMPAAADARCTLVAPRLVPQHLRIEPAATLDAAVARWLAQCVDAGRDIVRVGRTATSVGPAAVEIAAAAPIAPPAQTPFASIVMLSWNASDYTEQAVASIRANTSVPHEIIIVDNGSRPDTLARLARIDGLRIIANAVNTGFAFACNQGLAAARGTHVVLLNNDVIVTAGWLEALIAVQQANPAVACSAPRTNRIAGAQQIDNVPYGDDLAGLPAFAAQRAEALRGRWTREYRVVGFCMCLDRRAIEEIGGLDPLFGTGNFEDDDYSMRIRAAGYDIAVCEDAFIHHFGSVSFRANNVDYNAAMARNRARFAERWNVTYAGDSYDARFPFRRGFVRARDFVPLPPPEPVGADWLRPA